MHPSGPDVSDPTDMLEIGKHAGSGGLGAIIAALLGRAVLGGGITDLKERVGELKADLHEQLKAVKEQIERSDRRFDLILEQVTTAKNTAAAAHSRFDVLEMRLDALERETRRKP